MLAYSPSCECLYSVRENRSTTSQKWPVLGARQPQSRARGPIVSSRCWGAAAPLRLSTQPARSHCLAWLLPAAKAVSPGVFQSSVVEFREQLKGVCLLFVMIDEQRRLVPGDQLPDFFDRGD